MLIAFFTVAAVCANIWFVWPQAVRLRRSRDLDGVSPGTWTISVTLFSVWAAFAFRIPQLVKLTRSTDVTGVSATTWLLGATTAGCWLVVSIHRHATAVVVANSTALLATLILLATLRWRQHTARHTR